MEVPDNAGEGGNKQEGRERKKIQWHCWLILDPFEDQFEKSAEKRKEAVAKNELHRLKNIKTAQKAAKIKGSILNHYNIMKLVLCN